MRLTAEQNSAFSGWLKAARSRAGLTAKALAEQVDGLTYTQLLRLEAGTSGTTDATIVKLADALGVDSDEIRQAIGLGGDSSSGFGGFVLSWDEFLTQAKDPRVRRLW